MLTWLVALALAGCGAGAPASQPSTGNIASSVTPSALGSPLAITTFANLEFISIQGTGQIVTYTVDAGIQTFLSSVSTPCLYPSGMGVVSASSGRALAVVCYDTNELLTYALGSNGKLSALAQMPGLDVPFPGVALDGTTMFVPLYGRSQSANGSVAKVDLSNPAAPRLLKITQLASPATGGYVNPGALTVGSGRVYVAAGSESAPVSVSSTIQVLDEATLTLQGQPLVVDHSPQKLVAKDNLLFASIYDAGTLLSIDATSINSLRIMQSLALPGCAGIPLALVDKTLFVGCFAQGGIQQVDITAPDGMVLKTRLAPFVSPQSFAWIGGFLISVSGEKGGSVSTTYVGGSTGPGGRV